MMRFGDFMVLVHYISSECIIILQSYTVGVRVLTSIVTKLCFS